MNELYLANRNLSEAYRQKLQETTSALDQSISFLGDDDINPQQYYLDFKNRAVGFVLKETELLKRECLNSDNSHLILLKQTVLVDTIVQEAFTSALWLFNKINGADLIQEQVPLAILARGGYGREEMYFRSDADIQIVSKSSLEDSKKKWTEEIIRHFEYLFIFQDIFPTHSNSCYTEMETFEKNLNAENVAQFLALLEHRFVTGNIFVYKEFKSSVKTAQLMHQNEITKHFSHHGNYYEVQNTVFKQEPDIKEELRRLYWALASVRITQTVEKTNQFELLIDLYTKNLISPLAFKSMQKGLNFLSKVRLLLHIEQQGSHRDVMSYEVREKIAQSMGYEVKDFFHEYFFEAVYPLKRFSRNLYWDSMAADTKKQKTLSEYFALNTQNQIFFEKKPEVLFSKNPLWFFKLFVWVAEKNYYLSNEVIHAIEQNIEQANPIFTDDISKREIENCFKRIIRGKYFSKALRLLHEFGILENYLITEFKNLRGLLQDIYVHKFPTDLHILAALDALNGLEFKKTADPFLYELYNSQKDKTALKLAVLLHDIGKGAKVGNQNEELVGAQLIPQILENLGYGEKPKRVGDVAFLVEKHLTLYDLMLLDPEADETYDMALDLVNHDKERFKMLVLLTYADRGGTKMNMSSTQIEQLKLFYQYTLHHKSRESVPNTIKLDFLKMVRLPRDLQSQLEIYYKFNQLKKSFMAEMLFNPGQPADLIVCSQDTKGFLHKISTVLAFNQLDIVHAHIQTMKDKVFDVFKVINTSGEPIDYGDFFFIQNRIQEDLHRVFLEKQALSEVFNGRSFGNKIEGKHLPNVKLKMKTIGRSVKLATHNLPGTFMMETKVLSDANMECQKAVLHTHQGTASNIFYLRQNDVAEIMNHQDYFIQTFTRALQPLTTGDSIF